MRTCTAMAERCTNSGLSVGHVPGFPGAHSQDETLEEPNGNLREVIAMILDEGAPATEGEFVGTQTIVVAWAGLRLPRFPGCAGNRRFLGARSSFQR